MTNLFTCHHTILHLNCQLLKLQSFLLCVHIKGSNPSKCKQLGNRLLFQFCLTVWSHNICCCFKLLIDNMKWQSTVILNLHIVIIASKLWLLPPYGDSPPYSDSPPYCRSPSYCYPHIVIHLHIVFLTSILLLHIVDQQFEATINVVASNCQTKLKK